MFLAITVRLILYLFMETGVRLVPSESYGQKLSVNVIRFMLESEEWKDPLCRALEFRGSLLQASLVILFPNVATQSFPCWAVLFLS